EMWASLKHDLRLIYKMYGKMEVTDDTKEAINSWSKSGGAPAPDHPKLSSYVTRRAAHLLKLCVIAAASQDEEMIITLDHFVEALDWLTELERFIPDIFKSMKSGGDARAMEELYHFVYSEHIKSKAFVPGFLVHAFLAERVPVHNIEPIISS